MSSALFERTRRKPYEFPLENYGHPVDREEVDQVLAWLDGQKHAVPWLGLVLRMEEDFPPWLKGRPPRDPEARAAISGSADYRAGIVGLAMDYATGPGSSWKHVTPLRGLHACGVRAPSDCLKKLLESRLVFGDRRWVAGLLVDTKTLAPPTRPAGEDLTPPGEKLARLAELAGQGDGSFLSALYPGAVSGRWGREFTGAGRSICIIDSGCDESHLALQEQVRAHVFFDSLGYYKEAKYATDRGAHGTAVTGLAVGKPTPSRDLGLPAAAEPLRLGLAPGAKAVVVNVLQGAPRREEGTLTQLLSGLNWAVENMDDPSLGGYEVFCLSMEKSRVFGPFVDRHLDDMLGLMRYQGLAPVLAAGNNGPSSQPLGTAGTYVGAADSFGKPWQNNGRSHFLAPGVDLLTCQPPIPQLDNNMVGLASGTSLAAAVAGAAAVLLTEATGRRAQECLEALVETSGGRLLSLDAARAALG